MTKILTIISFLLVGVNSRADSLRASGPSAPLNGTVDTSKIATDAVTNVKLLNDPASLSKVTAGTMTLTNASVFISTGFVGKSGVAMAASGGVALEVAGVASFTYVSVGGNNGGTSCINPDLFYANVRNTGLSWNSSGGTVQICHTGNIGATITSAGVAGGNAAAGDWELGSTVNSLAIAGVHIRSDTGTGITARTTQGYMGFVSSAALFAVLQSTGGNVPSIGSFSLTNSTLTIITNVQSGPTSYVLGVASNTVGVASVFGVTAGGHVVSSGTTPSIACSAGSPVLLAHSNDQSGSFTAGAAATNCTITFVNTWAQIPVCMFMTNAATPVALSVTAISATAVTVSDGVAALTGDTLYYHCWGAP